MIKIKVEKELENWNVCLYVNDKFIRKICECYDEEYANLIAVSLANPIGAKVI
ncbi:hypothetical protein [Bacillus xiapuensis]|uniref:Uncharacterized protein n=1 Tax=Bacillus xiapuensis TaxID=2014075 RepID=A0ABU6N7Y1_9BACI|nr:hypothetical protein [Bacillus xiapuensis]